MINELPYNDVGLCLSAGLDSQCILFALLEAGKKVHTYSFTMDDRESRDFKMARSISDKFNVEFTPIYLPSDIDVLIKDLKALHYEYGCVKKTEYECVWPFLYLYKEVSEKILANGISSDGHFGLSLKYALHYKDRLNGLDEYRNLYWNRKNGSEYIQHRLLAKKYDITVFEPYRDQKIIDYFSGTTWEECNKPHQKQPLINSFSEYFDQIKIYPHTNFQLGDSGISEHFELLLNTSINVHNYKSVVGIFNSINRGEILNGWEQKPLI